MTTFADITITWDGVAYTIPSNRVLKAIAIVEGHLTLKEVHEMMAVRQTIKLAVIAEAMAALLAWLGCKSKDPERSGLLINGDEVYLSMFGGEAAKGSPENSNQVVVAMMALLSIMTPPKHLLSRDLAGGGQGGNVGKPQAPLTRADRRSKRRTKSQLATGVSARASSGN